MGYGQWGSQVDWQSKAKGKTKDLEPKVKAKAKDMINWPRGSSRPRPCPRGLHLCIQSTNTLFIDPFFSTAQTHCYIDRSCWCEVGALNCRSLSQLLRLCVPEPRLVSLIPQQTKRHKSRASLSQLPLHLAVYMDFAVILVDRQITSFCESNKGCTFRLSNRYRLM